MRSSAVLTDGAVRLWDLRFPASRVLLHRTRAAYVHLDSLIAFSKRDRDGKVDAYLACWLPDEVALLFFLKGELANAAVLTSAGRCAAAIPEVLRHMRKEPERAEIAFAEAPTPFLAAVYAACLQAPLDVPWDPAHPETVFKALLERRVSGVVEIISNGRLNYLAVKEGRFNTGHFADQQEGEAPTAVVQRLFTSTPPEPLPKLSVKVFPGLEALPPQAPPAMVTMFRHYIWDLVDLAEKELPNDAGKRAERLRNRLAAAHDVLRLVGGPRESEFADPIVAPLDLAAAVAEWTKEFLGELEVIRPKVAPRLLRDAAREHRYALASLGFFERLPWRPDW